MPDYTKSDGGTPALEHLAGALLVGGHDEWHRRLAIRILVIVVVAKHGAINGQNGAAAVAVFAESFIGLPKIARKSRIFFDCLLIPDALQYCRICATIVPLNDKLVSFVIHEFRH